MRSLTRMSRMMDKEGISRLSRAIALGLLMGSVAASGSVHANSCDLVKEGLVACYSFDGNANDASGNGNNGVLKGGITLTADRFGNANSAYQLDGIDGSMIEVANSPTLNVGTGDYSMAVWVRYQGNGKVDVWNIEGMLMDKRGQGEGTWIVGYGFYFQPGQLGTEIDSDKYLSKAFQTTAVLEDGQWHHVVATVERKSVTGLKLYMDGKVIMTSDPTPFASNLNNSGNLRIGISTVQSLDGRLDDVRIYNRAISEEEVKQLYEPAQNCKDKHATFDSTTGLVSIPALDIPTLDPFTGEPTGMLATFSAQLNLLKGVEDFGLIPDSFKVLQVDVTTPDPCNAGYSYADGKYSKGGTLHLPYVDVPSVIVIPPNTRIPGPVLVYDATLKQLAVDSVVFHIADYKNMGTLAIAK